MKFNLPRQVVDQEIIRIVSREMDRQNLEANYPTKENLKEIAAVVKEIEENGLPKYLVRKKLPNKLGYGLFLHPKAKPILKGQIIAPYSGDVTLVQQYMGDDAAYAFAPLSDIKLTKEEQAYFDSESLYRPRRLYSMKLDAEKTGNFTRFINHSSKPNIFADLMVIESKTLGLKSSSIEIVYVAKKTIHPGEQLLISYEAGEKTYWTVFRIKPFEMTPKTFLIDSSLKLIHKKL